MTSVKLNASEHQEQAAFVEWLNLKGLWHYAVVNALKAGGVKLMMYLKKEGLRPGVPDLVIPYKTHDFGGLYCEMKKKGGRVKPEQAKWHEFLRGQGYQVCVCYSADEAIEATLRYMNGAVNHA